jgi:hypothetical protein
MAASRADPIVIVNERWIVERGICAERAERTGDKIAGGTSG